MATDDRTCEDVSSDSTIACHEHGLLSVIPLEILAEAFRSTLPPLSSSGSLPSPPPPHHFELADGPRAAPGPRPGAVSQLEMNEEASSPLGR